MKAATPVWGFLAVRLNRRTEVSPDAVTAGEK